MGVLSMPLLLLRYERDFSHACRGGGGDHDDRAAHACSAGHVDSGHDGIRGRRASAGRRSHSRRPAEPLDKPVRPARTLRVERHTQPAEVRS